MPPEFAQQLQQLFARQMAVAYLHRCAGHTLPLNLVSARLQELEAEGNPDASAALRAEFTTHDVEDEPGGSGPVSLG